MRAVNALRIHGRATVPRLRTRLGWMIDDAFAETERAQCTTEWAHGTWEQAALTLETLRWVCVFINDTDTGKFEEWFGNEAEEIRARLKGAPPT